jgi:hypothetical protein
MSEAVRCGVGVNLKSSSDESKAHQEKCIRRECVQKHHSPEETFQAEETCDDGDDDADELVPAVGDQVGHGGGAGNVEDVAAELDEGEVDENNSCSA